MCWQMLRVSQKKTPLHRSGKDVIMALCVSPPGASPKFLLAAPASGVWRTGTPGSLATWRGCDAWLQRAVRRLRTEGGLARRKGSRGLLFGRGLEENHKEDQPLNKTPRPCCLGMAKSIWAVPENLDNAACKNRLWESVLIWMHGCGKMS